jgi:Type VI secretion system/phage-baseplate injector OB domain
MNGNGPYWGKYRGTVVNNLDPMRKGRLIVEVPDVLSLVPSTWAEPCVPLAGPTGPPLGVYMVPPIGAGVWVEFEYGDPNKPIWVGCRWGGPTDLPLATQTGNPASPSIVMQTLLQNAIIISDLPPSVPPPVMPPAPPMGGIILKSSTGTCSIVVNDAGIFLSNGVASIQLLGPSVMINKGALMIT